MQLLCYGDSTTYGYDPRSGSTGRYDPQDRWVDILAGLSRWRCCNRGQNGRQIPHTFQELEQAKRAMAANARADLTLILLGTNDLLQGVSIRETGLRMASFLQQIRPVCRQILVVCPPALQPGAWITDSALPHRSQALAAELRAVCAQEQVAFLDTTAWQLPMAFDGVHLSPEGHRRFARLLWQALPSIFP